MTTTEKSSEMSEDTRRLTLGIVIDHDKKEYDWKWTGQWRGRDVKYVMNHVFRRYREWARDVRRANKDIIEKGRLVADTTVDKSEAQIREMKAQQQEEEKPRKRKRKETVNA